MSDKRPNRRFVFIALLWVPLFILMVAFNFFMDPYGIYNAPRFNGINAKKPEFASHQRLAKSFRVEKLKPAAIILGSSISNAGLDPDHAGWGSHPVYNLSLSGASIYEELRYFQHAHAINPLKQVIVGLDFFQFNIRKDKVSPDFMEERMAGDLNGNPVPKKMVNPDLFATLASLDALKSSINTLVSQKGKDKYRSNGMRDPEVKREDLIKAGIGYRQVFLNMEKDVKSIFLEGKSFLYGEAGLKTRETAFDHFKSLIQFAYQNGVDLKLIISPSHARLCETFSSKGAWGEYEEWKRQLVQINAKEAKAVGQTSFPLWDFSGYNAFTTEEVPPSGDIQTEMKWYWDTRHYKKELGDLVLNRVFNYKKEGQRAPDDFGVLISNENIEQQLAGVRQERERWRNSHSQDITEIW